MADERYILVGGRQTATTDQLPKFFQVGNAVFRRIAGDDSANRSSHHPIRFDAGLVHGFIHAGLKGAERAAALHHQHDLARQFQLGSFFLWNVSLIVSFKEKGWVV